MTTAQKPVVTREMIEGIRFVQNTLNAQLMIPDLGKQGIVLTPYEIVDFSRFFSKRELGQSSHLDHCLKEGWLKILETPANVADSAAAGTELKFTDAVKEEDKEKVRGEDLPKDTPVTDREETTFDKGLDAVEDKEIAEDEESKLGKKRRRSQE